MLDIEILDGTQKELVKEFEEVNWPKSDHEHYGDDMPSFRKESYTIVAREGSAIVGFVFLLIDTGVATVDSLLVDYAKHRSGVGSALLAAAEDHARAKDCHVMKIETGVDWGARAFYEKNGYGLRAELKGYYGKRDFVLLDKKL